VSSPFKLQPSGVKVLVAGVSTRAVADSAARAGFDVTAIDAFADLDQHPAVRAQSLGNRFSPETAARVAQTIESDAVSYGSNFENHPDAVGLLAAGRALWGNPRDILRRVRDPRLVAHALARRGIATAVVCDVRAGEDPCACRDKDCEWLVKPFASGGGHRIRLWRRGSRVPRGCYLQESIPGTPGSIAFVAAGGCFVPLGVFRQLIGEEAFGVSEYRYCGNILPAEGEDDAIFGGARALAGAVADEFGLVGVNGIDFVVREGIPYAVEVNPRWCASMELVERAFGLSVFGAHAAACRDGVLPDFDFAQARRGADAAGKAIVFARCGVTVGDTRVWLTDGDVRDVPHSGTRIGSGQPVCTVFAAGRNAAACRAALVRRAERIYMELTAML